MIAPGEVDERSINDVFPDDVRKFAQCHWFAGLGVWSHALRTSGWPDDQPVWTGSCPCQPFSIAGKGEGVADERHLWPSWFYLIKECQPSVIFGEQVAAATKHGWLSLVQDDLEGIGYAFGAHGLAACNIGAPHQRKRLYFVADKAWGILQPGDTKLDSSPQQVVRLEHRQQPGLERQSRHEHGRGEPGRLQEETVGPASSTGYLNGFWEDAEWLSCRDGKYRPLERETESQPLTLADGSTPDLGLVCLADYGWKEEVLVFAPLVEEKKNRLERLKGYGNAICAPVAAAFIQAYMESKTSSMEAAVVGGP